MKTNQDLNNSQTGFVSITVTMVIMGILVLITVGFANLVRREQRQALDRQLSTQAFYAAESGVNDAVQAINNPANASSLPTSNDCGANVLNSYGYNKDIDPASSVAYSCVLVDNSPGTLEYSSVGEDKSVIVPINSDQSINSITIGWQDGSNLDNPSVEVATSASHELPPKNTSTGNYDVVNGIGMVRVTLMPVGNSGVIPVRDTLINNARTYFLYPNGAGTNTGTYANNGTFIDGNCNSAGSVTGRTCESTITNIGGTSNTAYLRLKSIYKTTSITVAVNGGAAKLSGAQAVVDSTGKAQDVLRRIQVRVPVIPSYKYPEFALQTLDTVCKRMTTWPTGTNFDLSDPACRLN